MVKMLDFETTLMTSSEFLPQIDEEKCISCELCVRICPNDVLAMAYELPVVAEPAACNYSGVCMEVCPTGAISLMFEIVFSDEES
jgi:NAD-dependent dihydropyrimidine dehydrogenase PreA subunit